MIKDFCSKKQAFQDSVLAQIKNCQMCLNNCKGSVVVPLLEYNLVHNNLYLISEAHEISLVEHLPFLLEQNQSNEYVSVLLMHDLLKILKHVCTQEIMFQQSGQDTFDKFFNLENEAGRPQTTRQSVRFEPNSFFFANGKLKFCPPLISPCHNIINEVDSPGAHPQHYENLGFLSKLLLQFLKYGQDDTNKYMSLHKLLLALMDFRKEKSRDTPSLLAFIVSFKRMTKDLMKEKPQQAVEAKLIIKRGYVGVDRAFLLNIN